MEKDTPVSVRITKHAKDIFTDKCNSSRVSMSAAVSTYIDLVNAGIICPKCIREKDRCGCLVIER